MLPLSEIRAFHAEGSQKDIKRGSIIKFGNVKKDIGGCYNRMHSVFSCKDRGLYFFYVTMTAYGGKGYGQVWFDIVQDGNVRGQGVTGNGDDAPVGGIYAMIRCTPKSFVWVKQHEQHWYGNQGMWAHHCQFGGFKIAN